MPKLSPLAILLGMRRLACGLVGFSCFVLGLTAFGGRWETLTPMPNRRTEVAVAELQGKIYVIGGFAYFFFGGVSDAVEAYDPQTDRWVKFTPMPTARHGLGAGWLAGASMLSPVGQKPVLPEAMSTKPSSRQRSNHERGLPRPLG